MRKTDPVALWNNVSKPIKHTSNYFFSHKKLEDPGSISIPCVVGMVKVEIALCDSGASYNVIVGSSRGVAGGSSTLGLRTTLQ
ncbi:hypothetical protein A2U01_0073828, partial [Trifolium medium]|nr:hypothetical protein [Trifolium medium]